MKSTNTLRSGLLALGLLALLGCGDDEIRVDNGVSALLRVSGGQFSERDFPVDPTSDASLPTELLTDGGVSAPPSIVTIESLNNTVKRGTVGKGLRLVVEPNAATIAIGLEGDDGYWRVPVAVRSIEFSPDLETTATLDFDRSIPVGPRKLWLAAADKNGRFGAVSRLDLNIVDDVPTAPMVISLSWTANVDLDLVVIQPDGRVVTNKAVRSSSDGADAPKIDLDSNAMCLLDGHRVENASFTVSPVGDYQVFVRLASACGIPETGWTVRLLRDGQELRKASGVSYAFETNLPNGGPSGPGRLALRFNIGG